MSDTPRTDNECGLLVLATGKMVKQGAHGLTVPADFARQLERELTQAKAELAAQREQLAQWMIASGFATGHGDTFADLLAEATTELNLFTTALRAECERLRENRDGLQARIDELMLEYCADEMTEQQLEEYEKNQIAVVLDRKDQP